MRLRFGLRFGLRPALLPALLLTAAALSPLARAQPAASVSIVPRGPLLRGGVTDVSITLNDIVNGALSSGVLNVGIANGLVFVAPPGASVLQPGAFLSGFALNIFAPTANSAPRLGGRYASFAGSSFQASFSAANVASPGEIFRTSLYFPIGNAFSRGRYALGNVLGLSNLALRTTKGVLIQTQLLPATFTVDNRRFGDVDGNGVFNLGDVTLILRAVVGLAALDQAQSWYADLAPLSPNGLPMASGRFMGDGRIDLSDVVLALKIVTRGAVPWWPDPR